MGLNIKTLEKYNNVHLHTHEYQGKPGEKYTIRYLKAFLTESRKPPASIAKRNKLQNSYSAMNKWRMRMILSI